MSGRWTDPSAFRADPSAAPASRPSRRQTLALLAVLAVVAGAIAAVSYLIRPERARSFDLFHGSLFLADQTAPVAVDLATGKPTLRLLGADKQVGITAGQTLGVVPLSDHTLLLNETTGEFNMVDSGGFVVKNTGGGVPLAKRAGPTTAMGVAGDEGQAYIVRTGATGGTDVYLVGQPTVEAAISATKGVRPRASASMPQQAATGAAAATAANGHLWLLVDAGAGRHTIRELSVPAGSSTGAALRRRDHGPVTGAAGLGTATDASGNTVVGVASAGRIALFAPGSAVRTVRFRAPDGLSSVLPASNSAGRMSFLLRSSAGWSVVSVNADGSRLRGPLPLTGVDPAAQLAQPAASNGRLYTIDRGTGDILRIGVDGKARAVRGAAHYPLSKVGGLVVEASDFRDAYVVARGSRVVVNSPSHANALMIFTDGSHAPQRIVKSSAVTVNAAGGAEALTKAIGNPNQRPGRNQKNGAPKPKVQPVAPINNKIDCRTVTQKPHVPTVTSAVPGSRTVALNWTYPIITPQDCYPSTYLVSVRLISNGAPQPPSSVRVQGQTGVNLTGLFPSTTYEITVTAYINGQGTAALPVRVTTGPEGPAAPTNLAVTADPTGHWTIRFDSCGSVQNGCVAAQSWTVTPSFCDGRGLSSPPATRTVTADPTSRSQPPVTYGGSDDLLGRGLQFQVQGTGQQGQAGAPSAKSPCVYSWAPADANAMSLHASVVGNAQLGKTTSAKVSLDLGSDPVRAVGGVGARITFALSGPGAPPDKTVTYAGAESTVTVSFGGVQPGAQYSATATVRPPMHPGDAVSLPPVPVVAAADWPPLSAQANCTPEKVGPIVIGCDLTVTIGGLASSQVGGETFNLTDASRVVCGNTGDALSASNFDPSTVKITDHLSLFKFTGDCDVTLQLIENGGSTPYFGGTPSPAFTTHVTVGSSPRLNAAKDDFAAAWSSQDGSSASVQYVGQYSDSEVAALTAGWQETLRAPDGTQCGSSSAQPTHAGIYVDVSPSTCVGNYGSHPGWTLEVSYQNQDGSPGGDFVYRLAGTPPGFQPCNADNTLSAKWGPTKAEGVDVLTSASRADLAGCANWTYQLFAGQQPVCTVSTTGVTSAPPTNLSLATCGTPPADGWKLDVTWRDLAGTLHDSGLLTISGTPPPS